jgi:hypothetical protein
LYSKKAYQPEDLTIEKHFRFEGMTNPADQTELMAISCQGWPQRNLGHVLWSG